MIRRLFRRRPQPPPRKVANDPAAVDYLLASFDAALDGHGRETRNHAIHGGATISTAPLSTLTRQQLTEQP